MRTRLKLGEKQAHFIQDYQSIAVVVSQALGGGTKAANENKNVPQNKAEAQSLFNRVFGKKVHGS